jgi:hypothetical protein
MEDYELRLECLRLALQALAPAPPATILAAAKAFERWITAQPKARRPVVA